jgi:hypothetical protein
VKQSFGTRQYSELDGIEQEKVRGFDIAAAAAAPSWFAFGKFEPAASSSERRLVPPSGPASV